ncbi:MAG: pectate lyase [Pirellulales bacterium]
MKLNLASFCLAFSALVLPAYATVPPQYENRSAEWFRSEEGCRIADNVVWWQSAQGSWPKNRDTASLRFEGEPNALEGTFDNEATISELRFLARAIRATGESRYKRAFDKGLDHILEAQYATGGWPQRYPPGRSYQRHITYNDNTMVRILELLRDVAVSPEHDFLEVDRRSVAKTAFDRGIQCILDCQIIVDGERMVWCAQHDEVDLRPRPARSYELESLSGAESAGILKLLMSLENPSPEIQRAVHAGAAWYESAKITGIRVESVGGDRVVVEDSQAPPVWARFYEIESNRPFFCGRDGAKKDRLSEIEAERRRGYAWYGRWGDDVAEAYEQWKKQQ